MPVDEALRSESDFTVRYAGFQKIADLDMHLFAYVLGNHNLKFVFYGNNVHG